jgi:prefoldin subunit 5
MTDTTELKEAQLATAQELKDVIAELEQYRERLVSDTLSMAQRAKVMKAQALASLAPQLAQIDAQIESLRQQFATLTEHH